MSRPLTEFCPKCLGNVPRAGAKKHIAKCQGKQSSRQREPEKKKRVPSYPSAWRSPQYNLGPNDTSTHHWGQW